MTVSLIMQLAQQQQRLKEAAARAFWDRARKSAAKEMRMRDRIEHGPPLDYAEWDWPEFLRWEATNADEE